MSESSGEPIRTFRSPDDEGGSANEPSHPSVGERSESTNSAFKSFTESTKDSSPASTSEGRTPLGADLVEKAKRTFNKLRLFMFENTQEWEPEHEITIPKNSMIPLDDLSTPQSGGSGTPLERARINRAVETVSKFQKQTFGSVKERGT